MGFDQSSRRCAACGIPARLGQHFEHKPLLIGTAADAGLKLRVPTSPWLHPKCAEALDAEVIAIELPDRDTGGCHAH